MDGVQRMRERPIQDLVDGLVQLGVDAKCTMGTGCPPVEVNANGLPSGKVNAVGTVQFRMCSFKFVHNICLGSIHSLYSV